VPAAAVIPALIAYIKVAAVKKLVVGFQDQNYGNRSAFFSFFLFSEQKGKRREREKSMY